MAALAGHPPNGFLPAHTQNSINEIEEYEKILRIRDQVFAGSHPRLTVPAHALRKVSPRLPEVPPLPIQSRVEFLPTANDHSSVTLPGPHTSHHATEQTIIHNAAMLNGNKPHPQLRTPQPTASGIDPIFLTKSDELIRQETVFQRSRLEKQLREQFEKKKSDARCKPHPEEVKPELNVSAMFAKIVDAVKPVEASTPISPSARPSPGDSFDENSFYSSRAPDSTPEEGALSEHSLSTKHQAQPRALENLDADSPVDHRMLRGQQVDRRTSPYPANPRHTRTVQSTIPFPYDLRQDRGMLLGVDTVDLTSMDVEDEDEPEYSPPEPAEQFPSQNNDQAPRFDYRDPRTRPLRRYSGAEQHHKRPGSPLEADMRITTRSRHDRNYPNGGQADPARRTPDYMQAPENNRKKRKLDKKANRMKKRKGNMAGSPDAHVKDEPVSPPPFHEIQPLGALKSRTAGSTQPIFIDDEPDQDRYGQPLTRQVIYDEAPAPRSDPRPYSRASVRPLVRVDQDLRRVASLHSMRADPPADFVDIQYNTPTRARAPSYVMVESPHTAPKRSNREPMYVEQRSALREGRAMGSPAPAHRTEPDPQVRYRAAEMLPPQRKILVHDQDGNPYYQIISHEPVAQRDLIDTEGYNDNLYIRSSRAGSVYAEPPREKRYVQDMPPPQVSYRRIGDVPVAPVASSSHVQRSASVQLADYGARQPIYAEEQAPIRAPVRMGSVRPQESRYGEVRMPSIRVQSVHPGGRESSVFMEDRQVRREYVAMQAEQQQPVYRRIVQDGQDGHYYEMQDPRY